ncbi:MAG: hypothetical protein V4726_18695 [Verrucomicrobiota bacterium]
MKRKQQAALNFFLGLAALAGAGLLASRMAEHRILAGELAALSEKNAGIRVRPSAAPAPPPGGGRNLLLKPFVAKSGDEARRELVRQLRPESGSGANRDPLNRLAPLLEGLSAEELLAVIGTEPAAQFTLTADLREEKPQEEIDEARARLAALRRLCVIAPEQALAVCAAGAPPKASDQLINVTALALRQLSAENPVSALHWGKENPSLVPNTWPALVLTQVAKADGLDGAVALARREGLLLAESMRWFDIKNLDSVNALMTAVDAERAAAGDSFAGNVRVRGGYQAVAEKISNSLGFGETRKFAEQWTAELPWREDTALLAVQSTLGPDSASQTEAAADWMMDFVPGDRRAAAAEKLMYSLSGWPATLTQWLEKHQAAPWRDPGLAAFARRLAPASPGMAVQWANAISDETLRATTLAAFAKLP